MSTTNNDIRNLNRDRDESRSAVAAMHTEVDTRLEGVVLPVSDVDRAKAFYAGLGWRLDAEAAISDEFHVMQLTPPGSHCSVIVGKGITTAKPGSVQDLMLVVDDIDAARNDLIGHGAKVSEVFHDEGGIFHHAGTKARLTGPDPLGRPYSTWALFQDPDGNGWLLQEVKTRAPGRVGPDLSDAVRLTELLAEAEAHHGIYEQAAPKHAWSEWYGAYLAARAHGKAPDVAASDAARHVESLASPR